MVHLSRSVLLVALSIAALSQAIADYSCSHTDDLDIVSCALRDVLYEHVYHFHKLCGIRL